MLSYLISPIALQMKYDVVIIGGGAAGFFTAINVAERVPGLSICILEKGKEVLAKVKISGGGRCNVTHAEFDPDRMIENYPRGKKELRGPFHRFCSGDTVSWFQKKGIELKTEGDGRMFPVSNTSQTIIDCFLNEIKKYGIHLYTAEAVVGFSKKDDCWNVVTKMQKYTAKKLVITTGSSPKLWKILETVGHTVIPPVPSLFTFNIKDKRIKDLPGFSVPCEVSERSSGLISKGPLLITHWGMSGPAILKLSALGAREFHHMNYQFRIRVNWLNGISEEDAVSQLIEFKTKASKITVLNKYPFVLPKRLWRSLVDACGMAEELQWANVNKLQLKLLVKQLTQCEFEVYGKSRFKEEFVTAGGVALKEINFKRFESKIHPSMFMAGEVLNIDAVTGGFNFQNAWTGGFLIANAIASDYTN